MVVIPEVLNRESILFKKFARTWIPAFAGMTTFYEFITIDRIILNWDAVND
jgi:hypothetical protein